MIMDLDQCKISSINHCFVGGGGGGGGGVRLDNIKQNCQLQEKMFQFFCK